MKADTLTLQRVLHGNRGFIIPVYQPPYIWGRQKQWEPVWADIEATVLRLAGARTDGLAKSFEAAKADRTAQPHFLGAVGIAREDA